MGQIATGQSEQCKHTQCEEMGEVGGGALMARACLINKINSRAREPTDVYV